MMDETLEPSPGAPPPPPGMKGHPGVRSSNPEVSECLPRSIEELVQNDLAYFWQWCPAPADGLHRCALLVKLLDYTGSIFKEGHSQDRVQRLDQELRACGVMQTDRMEPNQRVQYQQFVCNGRLRDVIAASSRAQQIYREYHINPQVGTRKTVLGEWILSLFEPEANVAQ